MARDVTGRVDDRSDLRSEADRLGIETSYVDAQGRPRRVAAKTVERIVAVLRGTGAPIPTASAAIAVDSPDQAFQGASGRHWLLAAQLYAVRSRRNWGHGD